jgi:hypothetical protein
MPWKLNFEILPVEMGKLPRRRETSNICDRSYFVGFKQGNKFIEGLVRMPDGANRQLLGRGLSHAILPELDLH